MYAINLYSELYFYNECKKLVLRIIIYTEKYVLTLGMIFQQSIAIKRKIKEI